MGGFCKCCTGECTCGTVTPPTITIAGYTASGGWSSLSDCCKVREYSPNESDETECCGVLHEKTWTQKCERKAWALNFPIGIDSAGNCPPDPAKFCIPDPPLTHIGTNTLDYTEIQRLRFCVQYDKPSITVYFGKDNFTCGGVTECKWFLKIRLCYNVTVIYDAEIEYTQTLTTTAVHPCFVAQTLLDGTSGATSYIPCTVTNYTVCFDRIKIWDVLPANGDVVFLNADTGSACEVKPTCANIAFDETEYCFASPPDLASCFLCWDYSIVADTVTYIFGGNTITSYNGPAGCGVECTPAVTNCAANPTVCPTRSQTLPCQKLEFGRDPNACDCVYTGPMTTFFACPNRVIPPGSPSGAFEDCGFFSAISPVPYFGASSINNCPPSANPCNSTCCHYFDCQECSQCSPKFGSSVAFYGSQEITVSTTCDALNPTECCISYPTTTLNVVW